MMRPGGPAVRAAATEGHAMTADNFYLHPSRVHGTDTASLLRRYHRARHLAGRAGPQVERDDAARSARQIARELLGRGVRV
jgi:hypothetical protein